MSFMAPCPPGKCNRPQDMQPRDFFRPSESHYLGLCLRWTDCPDIRPMRKAAGFKNKAQLGNASLLFGLVSRVLAKLIGGLFHDAK